MFKILIFFLIFYLTYKFIKNFFISNNHTKKEQKKSKKISGEKMVLCESCNVYFPESQSILMDGKIFCSKECVDKYLTKP
jgi:uncharacterized protein